MLEGVKWKDLEEGTAENNSSTALDVLTMFNVKIYVYTYI